MQIKNNSLPNKISGNKYKKNIREIKHNAKTKQPFIQAINK